MCSPIWYFEALRRYRRKNGHELPTTLVLEEAHTFVHRELGGESVPPAGRECAKVFERIVREGRKFGLVLHTNQIENETFYDCHIHVATERYQELGAREDAYALPTDRYGTFRGALDCLFSDANFSVPPNAQGVLFDLAGGV